MIELRYVEKKEIGTFRAMAERYWDELMPYSVDIRDPSGKQEYFSNRYTWEYGNYHPLWALAETHRVGFVCFDLYEDSKTAVIGDLYVDSEDRRKKYGSEIVNALFDLFDQKSIERVDLNVRRDNPAALAFWEKQGFMIALYRLRMYRDPNKGISFVGALSSDFVDDHT